MTFNETEIYKTSAGSPHRGQKPLRRKNTQNSAVSEEIQEGPAVSSPLKKASIEGENDPWKSHRKPEKVRRGR